MLVAITALGLVAAASCATVTITNGTVVGQTVAGVDRFLGIPYAQAPVGPLRFRPPLPLNTSFGTINLPEAAPACYNVPVLFSGENAAQRSLPGLQAPFLMPLTSETEDCLTVDIARPVNTTKDSRLPVFLWIYGGGFIGGASQQYPGDKVVKFSVEMGTPVLYIAPNYRVGPFGFLTGRDVQAERSSNAGLRDLRLALQWVQDNIAEFGGDPDKVTLLGESAGAHAVMYQTIINNGDNTYKGKPLFRGAVQNSGAGYPVSDITSAKAQSLYDAVIDAAGCGNATQRLDCLRALTPTELLDSAARAGAPTPATSGLETGWRPRPDSWDDFLPVSSEVAFMSKRFANVSYIIGNVEDEGTLFSTAVGGDIANLDGLIDFVLRTYFPTMSRSVMTGFASTYSLDPADGSPYDTGTANQAYPMYKQLAAMTGDFFFHFTRRFQLETVATHVPAWSFLMDGYPSLPWVGSMHGTDLYGMFSNTTRAPVVENSQNTYYINFVNFLDPNGDPARAANSSDAGGDLITWPRWTNARRSMLNYLPGSNQIIEDAYRWGSYEYWSRTLAAWRW